MSTMNERVRVTDLGCPGHFICAQDCRWRRHTQIGDRYRVSSVGDYMPQGKRRTIGAGPKDFFETMVFQTRTGQDTGNEDCGCRTVEDWCEIDGARYATAGEAQLGHEGMVEKYRALAEQEASE